MQGHWARGTLPEEPAELNAVLKNLEGLGYCACQYCRKLHPIKNTASHHRSFHCLQHQPVVPMEEGGPQNSTRDFIGPKTDALPPLRVVATAKVCTLDSIPEALRWKLADTARAHINAAVRVERDGLSGAIIQWTLYHMLWKTVLDSRGSSGKKATTQEVSGRLSRWLLGRLQQPLVGVPCENPGRPYAQTKESRG